MNIDVFVVCVVADMERPVSIADYISQYGDEDSIDSARGTMSISKQMANLNLLNNNHVNAAAGIRLGPVVTKKTLSGTSANTLNHLRKLPSSSSKIRSTPLTPEKVLFNDKSQSAKTSPVKKVRRPAARAPKVIIILKK